MSYSGSSDFNKNKRKCSDKKLINYDSHAKVPLKVGEPLIIMHKTLPLHSTSWSIGEEPILSKKNDRYYELLKKRIHELEDLVKHSNNVADNLSAQLNDTRLQIATLENLLSEKKNSILVLKSDFEDVTEYNRQLLQAAKAKCQIVSKLKKELEFKNQILNKYDALATEMSMDNL